MVEIKNWFFEQAVHPETHLIYANFDLDGPNHWKTAKFPKLDEISGKYCDEGTFHVNFGGWHENKGPRAADVACCPGYGGLFLG
jgi:hypothetical protein